LASSLIMRLHLLKSPARKSPHDIQPEHTSKHHNPFTARRMLIFIGYKHNPLHTHWAHASFGSSIQIGCSTA
jgi:hypothetical protein